MRQREVNEAVEDVEKKTEAKEDEEESAASGQVSLLIRYEMVDAVCGIP